MSGKKGMGHRNWTKTEKLCYVPAYVRLYQHAPNSLNVRLAPFLNFVIE